MVKLGPADSNGACAITFPVNFGVLIFYIYFDTVVIRILSVVFN